MSFLASAPSSSSSRVVVQSVNSLSTRAKSSTSTQGISRKAIAKARPTYKKPVLRESIKDEWYVNYRSPLPVFKDGKLSTKRMASLVDLYHQTSTHITKENLDEVIDAEFAPKSGVPRTRPQMASLIDLHLEMNDPGYYSRPANDWQQIENERAFVTGGAADGAASGVDSLFRNLSGTRLENVLPHTPGSSQTALKQRAKENDWVGARENELTPRQRAVVEALYGTDADRRPGLEGVFERLQLESQLEADARVAAVQAQEDALAASGDAIQALDTNIKLEPHIGPEEEALSTEEDPIAAEGLAEGGDVAPEDILTKEAEAETKEGETKP